MRGIRSQRRHHAVVSVNEAGSPSPPSGLARVATISFLAARAAPSGGFWIALAGGVALARGAQHQGARHGFGASLAAMLETVAIMGPARLGVPLTQAASAPMLGRLEARGAGLLTQILACAAIRVLHNALTAAFFIFVIVGGLDAYAGTYAALPLISEGSGTALVITGVGIVAWTVFATTVQVTVYRRGLREWPDHPAPPADATEGRDADPAQGRFDPRLVSLAAAVGFTVLLLSTAWTVLGSVALLLVVAWFAARSDARVLPTGAALAAILALGSLTFGIVGGVGLDEALRRATRAALLVLVATWMRAAAGSSGLREVSRRVLGRLRRLPSVPEAAAALDDLGAGPSLVPAGRSLLRTLGAVDKRPVAIVDAVLAWVASESARDTGRDQPVDSGQRTVNGKQPSALSTVDRPPSTEPSGAQPA